MENFQNLLADFPGAQQVTLDKNYRSTKVLHSGAAHHRLVPKTLHPEVSTSACMWLIVFVADWSPTRVKTIEILLVTNQNPIRFQKN